MYSTDWCQVFFAWITHCISLLDLEDIHVLRQLLMRTRETHAHTTRNQEKETVTHLFASILLPFPVFLRPFLPGKRESGSGNQAQHSDPSSRQSGMTKTMIRRTSSPGAEVGRRPSIPSSPAASHAAPSLASTAAHHPVPEDGSSISKSTSSSPEIRRRDQRESTSGPKNSVSPSHELNHSLGSPPHQQTAGQYLLLEHPFTHPGM